MAYLRALTGIDRWIWPEWSEADVSAEKWESGGTASGKRPEKGKLATPSYFEDPDGQPVLPRSLAEKCRTWRRIPDIYMKGGATTVFEELTPNNPISILQSNTHLLYSPYIRYLIGMRFDPIWMEDTLFLFIFLRLCIFFFEKKIFETFDISMTHLFFNGKHFLDINDHLL